MAHRCHVLFAAVTEVGRAHQVQEAAIGGREKCHGLWELRRRLATLSSHLPKQLHGLTISWTVTTETNEK